MYRIICKTDGTEYVLYDPRDDEQHMSSAVTDLELNSCGKLTFQITKDHPYYNNILPLISEISVYDGSDDIFTGRMITDLQDFYLTNVVECEGDLAYLLDSIMRPFDYSEYSVTEFLDAVIDNHNSQVEASKQFTRGIVNVVSTTTISRSSDEYEKSLEVLQEQLVKICGGCLRTRRSGGIRYLDYVIDYGGTNTQEIRFGENLLDISKQRDASTVITALIPTGAEIDNGDGTKSIVDIKSVNNDVDYISNADGISAYGTIFGHKEWQDITSPAILKETAETYLEEQIALPLTIDLTAFDLAKIDVDITSLKFGYWTNVISVPHDINKLFMIAKYHVDIMNPGNNKIQMGKTVDTFSGATAKDQRAASAKVNKVAQILSNEMLEAILNATELITGGQGGYMIIERAETDGHPEGITIMDAPAKEDAVNCVRINKNGIGFSTTGYEGIYANAWTIDGKLVADFITAGKLMGITIEGNTINGGTINGTTITGGTINGSTINSQGNGHNVSISGGNLTVNNDANNFLNVHQQDGTFAIGGKTFATYNGSVYYGDYETIYIGKAAHDAGAASDSRLKHDIETINPTLSKDIIMNTRPVQFMYNEQKNEHGKRFGVIANELREILDRLGVGEAFMEYVRNDGYHTVEYKEFIAHLINVAQSQQAEIDMINSRLEENGL